MQSLLYDVAYKTNENMLICAPTGAGKTDAAMYLNSEFRRFWVFQRIGRCVLSHSIENSQHGGIRLKYAYMRADWCW
jgi:hypothetical protein